MNNQYWTKRNRCMKGYYSFNVNNILRKLKRHHIKKFND